VSTRSEPPASGPDVRKPASEGGGEPPGASPRAGSPAPPGTFDGRARSFREAQTRRRGELRERIGVVIVVLIIVLGVYTLLTAKPYTATPSSGFPIPGPTINVILGGPTVTQVPCGVGGSAYAEKIPFTGSSEPITTGDVNLRVYEIWDHDFIPDSKVVANATPSNLCGGSPPQSSFLWYAVLAAPNGTNLLTYTQDNDWTAISPGPTNFWIANGSALIMVTDASLAGSGRGFEVIGYSAGSPIFGTIPL
jgi:hypothetical protein